MQRASQGYLLLLPVHPVLGASYLICLWLFHYADRIILLSDGLNDLRSMLSVCFNVSLQRLLKSDTNKRIFLAFGKKAHSAMFGDGLQLDNGVVMWCD